MSRKTIITLVIIVGILDLFCAFLFRVSVIYFLGFGFYKFFDLPLIFAGPIFGLIILAMLVGFFWHWRKDRPPKKAKEMQE